MVSLKSSSRSGSDWSVARAANVDLPTEHAPYYDPQRGREEVGLALSVVDRWGAAFERWPLPDALPQLRDEMYNLLLLGAQLSNQIGITGGNDRTQYALSGNVARDDGIVLGQNYDRKSMRVNFETQATPRLRFGQETRGDRHPPTAFR